MSYSIRCDHCKAILKSPTPVPAGKKIKCPKCKQLFTTPPDAPTKDDAQETSVAAVRKQPPPRPKAKPAPAAEPEEEIPEIDDDLVVPDDEPPAKKKRRDPDEEDDDEPRSKNRKKRAEEDDDEDAEDEDEDDRPRKTAKKKKKAGRPMMLILLLGGGFVALLACIGCGVGAFIFLGGGGPDILGKWENNDFIKITYEFRPDGTGAMQAIGLNVTFKYRLIGSELELEPTGAGAGGIFANVQGQRTARLRVTREGETLRMEELNPGRRGQILILRKAQ